MNANPANPKAPLNAHPFRPNGQRPPAEPVKPWVARPGETLASFLCDNGALYCCQHAGLTAKSVVPDRLEIKAPPYGVILAVGPAARELAMALCAGRATLIQANGTDLTSVTLLQEVELAAEAAAEGILADGLLEDPDLDEAEEARRCGP